MIVLYNRMAEREAQRMKFDAVIHGINLDEIPTESESVEEKERRKRQ